MFGSSSRASSNWDSSSSARASTSCNSSLSSCERSMASCASSSLPSCFSWPILLDTSLRSCRRPSPSAFSSRHSSSISRISSRSTSVTPFRSIASRTVSGCSRTNCLDNMDDGSRRQKLGVSVPRWGCPDCRLVRLLRYVSPPTLTASTGTGEARTTDSVTLPMSSLDGPVRPSVAITTTSMSLRST